MIVLDNTTLALDGQLYFTMNRIHDERERKTRGRGKIRREGEKVVRRVEWQPTPEVDDTVVKS